MALIPMYCAAMEYITATDDLSGGISRTSATNAVVLPCPTTRYPIGMASKRYLLTWIAPRACAPMMKYEFLELRSDVNRSASAYCDTPVMLPGKSITGNVIFFLI